MAVPTVTQTVVGGPLTLTAAAPTASVVVTDTGNYAPAVTARQAQINGNAVGPATLGTASGVTFCDAGTFPVRLRVTNADGAANGTAVNVVVTDSAYSGLANIGSGPGEARIRPNQLPWEFRDAMVCTPGLPTAAKVASAKAFGSILADADRGNVIVGGVPVRVALA